MLSAMEDTLQVGTRLFLWQKKASLIPVPVHDIIQIE